MCSKKVEEQLLCHRILATATTPSGLSQNCLIGDCVSEKSLVHFFLAMIRFHLHSQKEIPRHCDITVSSLNSTRVSGTFRCVSCNIHSVIDAQCCQVEGTPYIQCALKQY